MLVRGFTLKRWVPTGQIGRDAEGRAMFNGSQTTDDAIKFYNAKVEELGTNLKDLEGIVQGKSNNLRVVEDGEKSRKLKQV